MSVLDWVGCFFLGGCRSGLGYACRARHVRWRLRTKASCCTQPTPRHPDPTQCDSPFLPPTHPQKTQVGVLEDVAAKGGFKLNFKEALIGGAALDAKDDPFPDESLKA